MAPSRQPPREHRLTENIQPAEGASRLEEDDAAWLHMRHGVLVRTDCVARWTAAVKQAGSPSTTRRRSLKTTLMRGVECLRFSPHRIYQPSGRGCAKGRSMYAVLLE